MANLKGFQLITAEGYGAQFFEPKTLGSKRGGWLHIRGIGKFWLNREGSGYEFVNGKRVESLSAALKYAVDNLIHSAP